MVMSNLIGQSLGRYKILEQLGEGGMATVYKAHDFILDRFVAIKVIRTDQFAPSMLDEILKRFEREAKVSGKVIASEYRACTRLWKVRRRPLPGDGISPQRDPKAKIR